MKYDKNICDGCGRQFEDGDDIVVCPECGTPQHRECYNLRGECVNASKHAQGFSWNPQYDGNGEQNADQSSADGRADELICPACGMPNAAGSDRCAYCGQKFTVFGFNVVEKQRDLEKEEREKEERERENAADVGYDPESGEAPNLKQIIEMRAKVLMPGITDEQRREPLCGHRIVESVAFIGNNAASYVNKFRKIEREKKRTFNWGAFFFSPIWFFYRKLYKQGIVFATLYMALAFLIYSPYDKLTTFLDSFSMETLGAMTEAQYAAFVQDYTALFVPVLLLALLQLVLNLICALSADRMYHKYCTQSLFEVDAIGQEEPEQSVPIFLRRSSTSLVFALISALACSFLPNLIIMFISK